MPMLTRENLLGEIARLANTLPPFPRIVTQLLDMLDDDEASLDSLARIARNDPVISAAILATANRIRRIHAKPDVDDPFIAATLIGINQLRRIVITAAMNRFASEDKGAEFFLGHSRAVAIVAQELALLTGVSAEKAYVVAILHDIGQLYFHMLDSGRFQELYRQSALDGRLQEREAEAFGADHAVIGGALARYWQLPDDFVDAIEKHHEESIVTSRLQALINLAESLTRALDIPPSPKNRLTRLNVAAVETLGIQWNSPAMKDCFGRCRARFKQSLMSD